MTQCHLNTVDTSGSTSAATQDIPDGEGCIVDTIFLPVNLRLSHLTVSTVAAVITFPSSTILSEYYNNFSSAQMQWPAKEAVDTPHSSCVEFREPPLF